MKRIILVICAIVCITMTYAEKRLVSISCEKGNEMEQGSIEYDDQGRIIKYSVVILTPDTGTHNQITTYTYTGSDRIDIDYTFDKYSEHYSFIISNGKLISADLFFDAFPESTLTYEGDKFVKIANDSDTGYMTWNGDNLAEWYAYWDNEEAQHTVYTYNNISTHPLVHTLFGFSDQVYGGVRSFFEQLALYPYYGLLPKGLFEKVVYTEGRRLIQTYNFEYEKDSNDDIVKVTVTCDNGKTSIYTLVWESTSTDIGNVPLRSVEAELYYNLSGQQSKTPRKGVNIVGGKKVLVK